MFKFQKIAGEIYGIPQEQVQPVFIDTDNAVEYKKQYDKLMATQFNLVI